MPSTSGSSETCGGIDAETVSAEAVGPEDGPQPRSTASVGSESDRCPGYHHRVRVAALAAEREALGERVSALTAEMEELEAEVEALERAVESKERQRQQVIDSYEAIVADRSEADRASEAESTESAETAAWRPLAAVASGIERAVAWMRRPGE